MAIQFLGDAGVYLPHDDGVKFTGFANGATIEYIATRAAIIAAGANPTSDPASLLVFFEEHRRTFEVAAAGIGNTYRLRRLIGPAHISRARPRAASRQ